MGIPFLKTNKDLV